MNIQELRKADNVRGWSEIPKECPAHFVAAICEKRATSIATGRPIPSPTFVRRTLRAIGVCFEDLLQERRRRKHSTDADLRARLGKQHMEILKDFRKGGVLGNPEMLETKLARQAREIAAEQAELAPVPDTQWVFVGRPKE